MMGLDTETKVWFNGGMTTTQREGYTAHRNSCRDPQPVYSMKHYRKRNGHLVTERELLALDGVDVFDTGLMVLHFTKVRRSRGSWIFTNGGRIFTLSAFELKDARFVEVVG